MQVRQKLSFSVQKPKTRISEQKMNIVKHNNT